MAEQINLFARNKKAKKTKYGVGWLKVLVRFVLWVYAIYNLYIGAKFMTDAAYDDNTGKFLKLSSLSELAHNDFQYGVLCCVLFIMLLMAIYGIATFKKYADGYSLACFILGVVSSAGYFVVRIKTLGLPLFANGGINQAVVNVFSGNIVVLINLVFSILMLVVNIVYFSGRKHYFR